MSTGYLSPISMLLQVFSDQGVVGAGYMINTYVGGSVSTPLTTYADSGLTVPNSNPIVMSSAGRYQNVAVWVPTGTLLKMVLTDSVGVPIVGGTIDNLPGINDPGASSGTIATRFKAATTSRASITVPANDPDLQYPIVTAGTYSFTISAILYGTTIGTQGIKFNVNYAGSYTNANSGIMFGGVIAALDTPFVTRGIQSTVGVGDWVYGTVSIGAGSITDLLVFNGTIIATGAGTLAFSWSQNASSVNAMNVAQGSYMTVLKL